MRVIVFCGPTLSAARARSALPDSADRVCDVRPPAARGDVLGAALTRPNVIALIDGYFDRVPSVWHKEVLWALSQGIHVFGAASMGALRGAELAAFGMQGVGKIFAQYRDGILCDDDEVAVAHASEASAFRRTSEALVNLRATFEAAEQAGVIGAAERRRLLAMAQALGYWERSYPELLRRAHGLLDPGCLDKFARWLAHGRVDQKLEDALELMQVIELRSAELAASFVPSFAFADTDSWRALYREVAAREESRAPASTDASAADWFDELLLSRFCEATHAGALARALAERNAHWQGHLVNPRAVENVADDFRRERGLVTPGEFRSWLERHQVDEPELTAFFQGEAELRRARASLAGPPLRRALIAQLRADERFGELSARARKKRELLERFGLSSPVLADLRLTESALWQWYFETMRGLSVPCALEAYAEGQGVDIDRLRRAVLREYC